MSERLHKMLAQAGLGSRREMEELIRGGKVTVNGQVAEIGAQVGEDDLVKVNGRVVRFRMASKLPRILLYHKPEGEIVSRDDPEKRESVFDVLPQIRGGKWIALKALVDEALRQKGTASVETVLVVRHGPVAPPMQMPRDRWFDEVVGPQPKTHSPAAMNADFVGAFII
mgnify:CR=1 FL=1